MMLRHDQFAVVMFVVGELSIQTTARVVTLR